VEEARISLEQFKDKDDALERRGFLRGVRFIREAAHELYSLTRKEKYDDSRSRSADSNEPRSGDYGPGPYFGIIGGANPADEPATGPSY